MQIDADGLTTTTGNGLTATATVPVPVQLLPSVTVTVYVVVDRGLAKGFAISEFVSVADGDQEYEIPPSAFNWTFDPLHMVCPVLKPTLTFGKRSTCVAALSIHPFASVTVTE